MSNHAGNHAIGTALVVAFGVFVAAPAASQEAPKNNGYDPDKEICEKIYVLGSRLAVKRVCMTRAQWEERRRDDRQAIEAAQRSPCVTQGTGPRGKPSC